MESKQETLTIKRELHKEMKNTATTKQDRDFMKLRDRVFKVIPAGVKNSKEWRQFMKYMDVYYISYGR